MRTAMGWTCHTGVLELNERSIRNWPIQSTGADILRIACIMATRRGIKLLAPVHDAVLIEAPIERIEADVALMREIMRRASRIVLNATADGQHELRTDVKIVRHPSATATSAAPRSGITCSDYWRRSETAEPDVRMQPEKYAGEERSVRHPSIMVRHRGVEGHQVAGGASRRRIYASRLMEDEESDFHDAERLAGRARRQSKG